MKKSKIILITISLVCILAGAAMMAGAYFSMVHDASDQLAALEFQEKTHTITEPFTKLNIQTISSSIEILPASDGTCRIVCDDSEKLYHSFSITESAQGVQLNINQHDDWQWYEMLYGLYRVDELKVQIYLPEAEYELLHANSASGDITVAPDFRFQTLTTYTSSGNTKLTDLFANHLNVQSTSGDLILRNLEVTGHAYIESISGFTRAEYLNAASLTTYASSGDTALEYISTGYLRSRSVSGQILVYDSNFSDTSYFETSSGTLEIVNSGCAEQEIRTISGSVTLDHVDSSSLNIHASSGNLFLWDIRCSGNVLCNTVSGAVLFSGMDAENLEFLTSSGEVSGNLLSQKNFIVETSSGHVAVPPSYEGAGTCHIRTVSGNISIAIES